MILSKFFLKLMNNAVFGKTMENIRKQRDITTEGRRKYLVSKPNYYTTFFPENLLVIELKKSQRLTNKAVSSGLSILELSKILTYNYVKQKYHEKATFCYMDIDSFIVQIKTDDIHKEIAEDMETRFDISNFELARPLPKEKNEKVIGSVKDKLGEQVLKEFVGLREKSCKYLKDNNDKDKNAKNTKLRVIETNIKFENYKNCFEAILLENKINYLDKLKLTQIVLKTS